MFFQAKTYVCMIVCIFGCTRACVCICNCDDICVRHALGDGKSVV